MRRKRNPAGELLVIGANPPGKTPGSKVFGKAVDAIYYEHVTAGARVHEFERNNVLMEALPDGSIRIWHPEMRIWEDFT